MILGSNKFEILNSLQISSILNTHSFMIYIMLYLIMTNRILKGSIFQAFGTHLTPDRSVRVFYVNDYDKLAQSEIFFV